MGGNKQKCPKVIGQKGWFLLYTLPKTNIATYNKPSQKERIISQTPFLMGSVPLKKFNRPYKVGPCYSYKWSKNPYTWPKINGKLGL